MAKKSNVNEHIILGGKKIVKWRRKTQSTSTRKSVIWKIGEYKYPKLLQLSPLVIISQRV